MQLKFKCPVHFLLFALIIVSLGFSARLIQLDDISLSFDETYTQIVINQPKISNSIDVLLEDAVQPPLYFLILRTFPLNSDFILRLPSALMGGLSVAVIIFLAIQIYGDYKLALWAGTLLAINTFAIWHARTARPYSMVLLVGMIVSYFFLTLLNGRRSGLNWTLFIIISAIAYFTHYYMIGLAFAQFITMMFVLRNDREFFWKWVVSQSVATLPLFAWLYEISQQDVVFIGIAWIQRPTINDIWLTFWNMSIGYEGASYWYEVIGLLLAIMGFFSGAILALRTYKINPANLHFFLVVIAPISLVYTISMFRPIYVDRYFIFAVPGLIILIVQGLQRLARSIALPPLVFIGMLFIVCSLNFWVTLSNGDHEHADWRDAIRYILQNREADDGVVLKSLLDTIPFFVYSEGQEIEIEQFDADGGFIELFESSVSHVWIFYRHEEHHSIHRQGLFGENYSHALEHEFVNWLLENDYRLSKYKRFKGITVVRVDISDE